MKGDTIMEGDSAPLFPCLFLYTFMIMPSAPKKKIQ